MRLRTSALLVAVVFLTAALHPAAQKGGTLQTRSVYVIAVDASNTPVTDFTAADFEVIDAGVHRDVVRAGLAKSPMRIVVIVDTAEAMTPALNHLRAGLVAFGESIGPRHELALVLIGGQARVRVQPTTDHKKFLDAVKGVFTESGATILIDGLLETGRSLMKRAEDRWPIFVIVTADGAEGSSSANEKKFNEWVGLLAARDVGVHALVFKSKGGGMPEAIASHVTTFAGGRYEDMNTSDTLPEKLKGFADLLTRNYALASVKWQVTYTSDAPPDGRVGVGILREGIKFSTTQSRLR